MPLSLFAQNLVPNYSFEEFSACPAGVSTPYDDEVAKATGWSIYRSTPDYFHVCATNSLVSIPNNGCGYQNALGGTAYGGFYAYSPSNYREVIGGKLSEPLNAGSTYHISLSVFCTTWHS